MEYVIIAAVIVVLAVAGGIALLVPRRRIGPTDDAPPVLPGPGGTSTAEVDTDDGDTASTSVLPPSSSEPAAVLPPAPPEAPAPARPDLEVPEPISGRLVRLRSRLARSQSALGKNLLTLLSRDRLDDEVWEQIEETLIGADVGVSSTQEIVDRLRKRTQVLGTRTPAELRALLADELLTALGPDLDRELRTFPHADSPAVVLVVGVNGTGKTTTCGKLGRVLVAEGRSVVFGAADTFRAAAADQLETWGSRVGARTVRGVEGGDPAAIAFDAVKQATVEGADTVLIDTAGRLHTKTGLMDELGKIKRVLDKQSGVDETMLVLDATTGQNGLTQARVFTEVVDCTGIVLTKLDSTAKGGIVIAVQRELGIPVKLVGLGEGSDDLAPFEPKAFVDALIGD